METELFYPIKRHYSRRVRERELCPACNGKGLRPDGKGGVRPCVACMGIGTYKPK